MILMNIAQTRHQHHVRRPLVAQLDEQLQNLLTVLGKGSDLEVVHAQLRLRDAEPGRRLLDLVRERVRREAFRERLGGDRERDVAHLSASVDESRHRPARAELAVICVRREHENPLPAFDHRAVALSQTCRLASASAIRPSAAHIIGSSKNAL